MQSFRLPMSLCREPSGGAFAFLIWVSEDAEDRVCRAAPWTRGIDGVESSWELSLLFPYRWIYLNFLLWGWD